MSCHRIGDCFKVSLRLNASCPSFMSVLHLSPVSSSQQTLTYFIHFSEKRSLHLMLHHHLSVLDIFFLQARSVMLFISACTFAVRWIAKPKPLVDNTLSVSRCYSSLNCINVARWSRKLFVFLSSVCERVCVHLCGFGHCFSSLCFTLGNGCVNTPLLSIFVKFMSKWNFSWILKVSAWAHDWTASQTQCLCTPITHLQYSLRAHCSTHTMGFTAKQNKCIWLSKPIKY